MSMANNIKRGISKKKEIFSSQDEVRELLNDALSESLRQFITKLNMGEIPIDNIADAIRVYGAFKEINNIEDIMNGQQGSGMLPELNMRQEKVMSDLTNEGVIRKEEEDGEETFDISGLNDDDVVRMLQDMDIAQNSTNEELS